MATRDDLSNADAAPPRSFLAAVSVYLQPRVLIVMLLGFSAGLPLALSGSTLQVWGAEGGLDLRTLGLFTIVGTPYTIKFLWAPIVDALDVPVLSRWLGRRRSWLMTSQIFLLAAISLLAFSSPVTTPSYAIIAAILCATASATQDIVIDAFRIESLPKPSQAAGMASYVAAYRVANLISTAGVLFLVSGFERWGFAREAAWTAGYLAMTTLVVIGFAATLFAAEPSASADVDRVHQRTDRLRRVTTAAIGAFSEFLSRDMAIAILVFVVLFKLTDALAGAMTTPFVIKTGFSRDEYAAIIKGVGFAATLIGGFAGGIVARRYPLVTCLWLGAILQSMSNLAFSWQAYMGYDLAALAVAIIIENFTGAIGTVIFVAYLSALCVNPLHTATQYALLTALAAVGRTYLSAPAGYIAEWSGWPMFFVICALAAIPSLILLLWLQARGHFNDIGVRSPVRTAD